MLPVRVLIQAAPSSSGGATGASVMSTSLRSGSARMRGGAALRRVDMMPSGRRPGIDISGITPGVSAAGAVELFSYITSYIRTRAEATMRSTCRRCANSVTPGRTLVSYLVDRNDERD